VRVAIIGANGQLGADLVQAYQRAGHEVVGLTHADLDVRDASATQHVLARSMPNLVVNTAAMHSVEACEADPGGAKAVNVTGARNLAETGKSLGFVLAHISTDYVFDGQKAAPYVESDPARPLNVYGQTKLEGERAIQALTDRYLIVRTSSLYGTSPCRAKPTGNFVQTMLRLAREKGEVRVVTDEIVSPTYTADLAEQIVRLSDTGLFGVYHASSHGETSWYDYAAAIFATARLSPRLLRATSADFPQKAPRPRYSVLENFALNIRGLDVMPHWRESLERYFAAATL
jgi:dTDP-4-dehydrorhamnose reductase